MNLLRQRNGLYTLAFCGLVERLINFGIFTVLVLRLHQSFHMSDDASFVIFGIFTALSYAGMVLGGVAADRWLGLRQAVVTGGVLLLISTIFLALPYQTLFYLGLTLLIAGTALFKVSCTSLVGVIAADTQRQKENNFTWFYSCINIGALLGPLLYGVISQSFGWPPCLILSAILMGIALIMFLRNEVIKQYLPLFPLQPLVYLAMIAICVVLLLLFIFPYFAAPFMSVSAILLCLFISYILIRQPSTTRKKLYGLLCLSIFCMLFFACSFQVASSITLFVQRDIDKTLFGWSIPTPVFTALDPLFVVLMAPVLTGIWQFLARKSREPSVTIKIGIALGLAGMAFIALHIAALSDAYHWMAMGWLLTAYMLLGAGEICLTPAVFTAICQHAPQTFKSTMIGMWYLFIAGAGYVAGLLSKLSDNHHATIMVSSIIYSHAFIDTAIFAFIASASAFLLSPKLRQMLA